MKMLKYECLIVKLLVGYFFFIFLHLQVCNVEFRPCPAK